MNELLKQVYPEGEERWVKVKYTNPEVAMKVLRLSTPNFDSRKFGFETVSIGLREEYMPQVEALIELKAELKYKYELNKEEFEHMIDVKIDEVLNKVLISKL